MRIRNPQTTPAETATENKKPQTRRAAPCSGDDAFTNKSSALIDTAKNNNSSNNKIDRASSQTRPSRTMQTPTPASSSVYTANTPIITQQLIDPISNSPYPARTAYSMSAAL